MNFEKIESIISDARLKDSERMAAAAMLGYNRGIEVVLDIYSKHGFLDVEQIKDALTYLDAVQFICDNRDE